MIRVQYSTFIVDNLETAVSFYKDCLGFKEGYHIDLPNGARITIMESELASVELIEGKMFPHGFYSVGMDVDDLDKTLEDLKSKGCNPLTPVIKTSVGRQAFIMDRDNNRICLIEHTIEYKEKYMK